MHIYDFDKSKKIIKREMDLRIKENHEKLNMEMEIYKTEQSIGIKIIDEREKNYNIEDFESSFTCVKNKVIGVKNLKSRLIYKSISNKTIKYNEYINCEFNNIKFENCNFYGTSFKNCKFNKVYFSNCDFHEKGGVIDMFNDNCQFIDCIFDNTDLKHVVFKDSIFKKIKFNFTNLRNVIFSCCEINNILFCDCNLKSAKIIDTYINIFNFEDTYLTKVDENTFFDKLEVKNHDDYENLFKIYKNISTIYENNRLLSCSGEYYYLSKCMERKSLKGMERLKSKIFWMICGYGERPTFALVTSFEIVLLFAIIYIFAGLSINGQVINYGFDILKYFSSRAIYIDFIRCFYFSLVTFTSVGYGDIFPIGYSIIFSCIEMILGVTMVGVWTATLARKITR